MINKQRLLRNFLLLAQTASPSHNELELASILNKQLLNLGISTGQDNVHHRIGGTCGNLFGFLPGKSSLPHIFFTAHLDCVAPCTCVQPQVLADRIVSSGDTVLGADDKSGLAAIMEALTIAVERRLPHGDITVIFTVAEESGMGGSRGISHLPACDYGYCFDSSGRPGKIVLRSPGANTFNVKIYGRAVHAGISPETGINAIQTAARAISILPQGRLDADTTANIGIIHGGLDTNIVSPCVELTAEIRSLNADKLTMHSRLFQDIFHCTAQAGGAKVLITACNDFQTYALNENMPLIRTAVRSMLRLGLTPTFAASGGGSDANIFNARGLPCVPLATGMTKAHSTEEYILLEDLYASARLALALIQEAAKENAAE